MAETKGKDAFDDKSFGAESEVQSQEIDWGVPGDFLVGTFVKARHNVDTTYGKNSIYEIFSERGQFHKLEGKGRMAKPVDQVTKIEKGETWNVWGRGDIFNGMMNSLRPGQVVKLQFIEEKEGKNGSWKDIKLFAPKGNDGKPTMNQEWLDTQGVTGGDF